MPFSQELPKYALEALKPLLAIWERAGASERRLKEEQLPTEVLSAVRGAFSRQSPTDTPLSRGIKMAMLGLLSVSQFCGLFGPWRQCISHCTGKCSSRQDVLSPAKR